MRRSVFAISVLGLVQISKQHTHTHIYILGLVWFDSSNVSCKVIHFGCDHSVMVLTPTRNESKFTIFMHVCNLLEIDESLLRIKKCWLRFVVIWFDSLLP